MTFRQTFALSAALTLGLAAVAAAESALPSTVTYQGRLHMQGLPVTDVCDFEFTLWDNQFGGNQVGLTVSSSNLSVENGLFTADLAFGGGAFNGNARFLEISVRCPAGIGSYTTLTPRVILHPAPHALALPGLRTEYPFTSPPGIPNLIGGQSDNVITSGVTGGTIGGGGFPNVGGTSVNRVTDDFGTIGGGGGNQAGDDAGTVGDARYGTVAGGRENTASGFYASVIGGAGNVASGLGDTIGGGEDNLASGGLSFIGGGSSNTTTTATAVIGGGYFNIISGDFGTIAGGGTTNPADPATANRVYDAYGTIGGGGNNVAGTDDADTLNAHFASVGGGRSNTASGRLSVVGGGDENNASGEKSTVGGGASNTASLDGATVGGGLGNTAGNFNSTVAGGNSNQAIGDGAAVLGGAGNIAAGFRSVACGGLSNEAIGDHTFAAGRRAKAMDPGAFVWADSLDADFFSTAPDQFLIRAVGGVGIGTSFPAQQLHVAGNAQIDGTLTTAGRARRIYLNPQSLIHTDSLGSTHDMVVYQGTSSSRLTPWNNGPTDHRYSYISFNHWLADDFKGSSVTYGLLLMADIQEPVSLYDWSRCYGVNEVMTGWNLFDNQFVTSVTVYPDRMVEAKRTVNSAVIAAGECLSVRFEVRSVNAGNQLYVVGAYVEYTGE